MVRPTVPDTARLFVTDIVTPPLRSVRVLGIAGSTGTPPSPIACDRLIDPVTLRRFDTAISRAPLANSAPLEKYPPLPNARHFPLCHSTLAGSAQPSRLFPGA